MDLASGHRCFLLMVARSTFASGPGVLFVYFDVRPFSLM